MADDKKPVVAVKPPEKKVGKALQKGKDGHFLFDPAVPFDPKLPDSEQPKVLITLIADSGKLRAGEPHLVPLPLAHSLAKLIKR